MLPNIVTPAFALLAALGVANASPTPLESRDNSNLTKRAPPSEPFLFGHQHYLNTDYAVIAPNSETDPCKLAQGTWTHGGEWKDPDDDKCYWFRWEDWDYQICIGEEFVRGRNGKVYGNCVPYDYDTQCPGTPDLIHTYQKCQFFKYNIELFWPATYREDLQSKGP